MQGFSRRAFGRLIGVGPASVQKAVDSGRISVLPDGSIDPVAARAQWESRTDPARRKAGDRGAYQAARTRDLMLKAQERALRLADRRKTLVPVAAAQAHVSKAFASFCDVMRGLPSRHAAAMANELGIADAAALEMALSKVFAAELEGLSAPIIRT